MSESVEELLVPRSARSAAIHAKLYLTRESLNVTTIAIVAHPYGPLGGTQNDPVVVSTARELQSLGLPTITFDFASPTSWRGGSERSQYLDVLRTLSQRFTSATQVCCCGYSYGTLCLPTPNDINKSTSRPLKCSYIVISPLLNPLSFLLTLSKQDWYQHVRAQRHLAIWGEHDTFTSANQLRKVWHDGITVPEADHFWRSKAAKEALLSAVRAFITDITP